MTGDTLWAIDSCIDVKRVANTSFNKVYSYICVCVCVYHVLIRGDAYVVSWAAWEDVYSIVSLHWRHNERLFMCRSKKTSKLCVTGLCVGNSPVTGEFPAQRASNAERGFPFMTSSDLIVDVGYNIYIYMIRNVLPVGVIYTGPFHLSWHMQ